MAVLSKILEKKLRLYVKKVSIMGRVFADRPHYIFNYKDFKSLRIVISKEIAVNRRLMRYMRAYAESNSRRLEPFIVKFETITRDLIRVLRKEAFVLKDLGFCDLLMHEFDTLVLRQSRATRFGRQFSRFKELHKQEQDLDARLFTIASHERKKLASAKFRMYKRMAQDIRVQYQALAKSVGNSTLVRKNAQELLKVVKALQGTELYAYMHEDLKFIKNNVQQVIKDPNKSKVKTVLATAYIFSPGTFEATAYIMLVKNFTKLTVNKIKKKVPRSKRRFVPRTRAS